MVQNKLLEKQIIEGTLQVGGINVINVEKLRGGIFYNISNLPNSEFIFNFITDAKNISNYSLSGLKNCKIFLNSLQTYNANAPDLIFAKDSNAFIDIYLPAIENIDSTSTFGGNLRADNIELRFHFGKNITSIYTGALKNVSGAGPTSSTKTKLYFELTDNDTPLITELNFIISGTSKTTCVYNLYTDNTSLKDNFISKADQYTIVNVYHLDGSNWEV